MRKEHCWLVADKPSEQGASLYMFKPSSSDF
jgi:hypothetical protein